MPVIVLAACLLPGTTWPLWAQAVSPSQTIPPAASAPAGGTSPQQAPQTPAAVRPPGYNDAQKLPAQPTVEAAPHATTDSLRAWEGLEVEAVEFKGVDSSRL